MEGTPPTINEGEVRALLEGIEGVKSAHDLHIWTITSGLDMLTCHLLIEDDKSSQVILQQAIDLIHDHCKIEHTTIQVEKSLLQHGEMKV